MHFVIEELEKRWIAIYNNNDFVGMSHVIKDARQALSKCLQSTCGIGRDNHRDSNYVRIKLCEGPHRPNVFIHDSITSGPVQICPTKKLVIPTETYALDYQHR